MLLHDALDFNSDYLGFGPSLGRRVLNGWLMSLNLHKEDKIFETVQISDQKTVLVAQSQNLLDRNYFHLLVWQPLFNSNLDSFQSKISHSQVKHCHIETVGAVLIYYSNHYSWNLGPHFEF